jgi:integrase
MAMVFDRIVDLDGRRVGYGIVTRTDRLDTPLYVRFLDRHNKRAKRALGITAPSGKLNKTQEKEHEAAVVKKAEEIIAREFRTLPAGTVVTWDDAIEKLKTKFASSGRRLTTLVQYVRDVNLIRKTYAATTGPADIDERMAQTWLEAYTTGTDQRVKYGEARTHSAHNVKGRLGSLSAVWGKWFHEQLAIVKSNPFANLEAPKADKKPVRYVTDEQMTEFFAYLTEFYQGWEFPMLFFSVKAFTGCRLADISGLKSEQVRGGCIVFAAGQTKGRKERKVPLPEGLYDALQKYAGETYLWERYPTELKAVLEKKCYPTHQLNTEFAPERLYEWVLNLFKSYRETKPKTGSLNSHQFRARAFTKAWEGGVNPKAASIAFGCNQDTLLKHYVALDEQKTTDDVFEQIGKNILPGTRWGHDSAKIALKKTKRKRGSE